MQVKGIVHQKMKIHSLSTPHYADGAVGEVFESRKHLKFQGINSVAAKSNTIEVNGAPSSNIKKQASILLLKICSSNSS